TDGPAEPHAEASPLMAEASAAHAGEDRALARPSWITDRRRVLEIVPETRRGASREGDRTDPVGRRRSAETIHATKRRALLERPSLLVLARLGVSWLAP